MAGFAANSTPRELPEAHPDAPRQLDAETRVEVLQMWLTRAVTAARAADVFAA